jgi:hypothetical protein
MTLNYGGPLLIGEAFQSRVHLKEVMEALVGDLIEEMEKNKDVANYIPPIVYSKMGRAFNVHYNFFIKSLAYTFNDDSVYSDFAILPERRPEDTKKLGMFLVASILEEYHEMVKLNNTNIDVSKYRNARSLEIPRKFYNTVVYKNKDNYVRFNAVPLLESKLQKLLDEDRFEDFKNMCDNPNIEQVAFGDNQYFNLKDKLGLEAIDHSM